MATPNKRQSKELHLALARIVSEIENNNDVEFTNQFIDFINANPVPGQGELGHYGLVL